MRYGKINEAIWGDDKFQRLTDRSKLLYIYLLSCENCNSIGIFRIGYGTMEDGFGCDRADIKQGMQELEGAGLIGYRDGWLWFNKYLRWNEPTSPNHAKQCASYVNDCVKRGAPVEAVWGFLRTTYDILGKMGKQTQENGERKSYYDEFKRNLNRTSLAEFLGGEERLYDCLSGKKMPSESTKAGVPKHSLSTFKEYQDAKNAAQKIVGNEALDKHLPSTSNKDNDNNKDKDNNKTRQDNDNKSIGLSCNNGSDYKQITLTCNDGLLHEIPVTTILTAIGKHPGLDINKAAQKISDMTAVDPVIRPDPKCLETFFLNAIRKEAVRAGGVA